MQRVILAVGLAASGASLNGCGCAYGGPGCGLPGLEGLCEARLEARQSVVVTAVYGDDTGYHPATVRSAETLDTAVLRVSRADSEGELSLDAQDRGDTALRLKVEGWEDDVFTWSFTVQDEPVEPAAACPDALIPDPAR